MTRHLGRLVNCALILVIACCLWVAAGGASDGALTERSGPKGPNAERDNHGEGRSPSQPLRSLSACGASSVTPERSTPVVTNPCADGRYQGLTARQWAKRAVQQRKNSNARGLTIRRLKRELAAREIGPTLAIRIVFGAYAGQALRVAWCESRWHTGAQNGQFLGLFQMGNYARGRYGHSYDALGQARAAFAYFVASGRDWSPWECRP